MADLLYIANAALDLVGQGQIVSLDDNTAAAKAVKRHIYQAVREVLTLGKWKCAHKQSLLSQLTDTPAFQWNYAYQLPGDYLRMVQVVAVNGTWQEGVEPQQAVSVPEYDILGRQLFSNEGAIQLTYVADLSADGNDMGAVTAFLVELMALKLAQKIVWSFQQSRALKESLEQEYQLKRRMALAADAQETKNPQVNRFADSEWLRERLRSTDA